METKKELHDDDNPEYMFSLTNTSLLVRALDTRHFDILEYVHKELANRGLDQDGKWVGFDKAKEIHSKM